MKLDLVSKNTLISIVDKKTKKSKSKRAYSDLSVEETSKIIRKRLVRRGLVGKKKKDRKYYVIVKKGNKTKTFSIKGKETLEETFNAIVGKK